jgi:uncharacterized protein
LSQFWAHSRAPLRTNFFATCCKRYAPEIGTAWVRSIFDPTKRNTFSIGEITLAEVAAALALKQKTGAITSSAQTNALKLFLIHCKTELSLIPLTRIIIDKAVILTQQHKLRGYDAVQLSTAISSRNVLASAGLTDFIFVSADKNLLQAAQAEGLVTENPNQHP